MQVLQTKKVRVLRSFYDHTKQPTQVGAVVELPKTLALEMIAANKAAPADESAPAAKEPAKTEKPAEKEAKNAR